MTTQAAPPSLVRNFLLATRYPTIPATFRVMKIVINTGVTRGLGRALVAEFIGAGHTVIGCGRGGDAIFDLRMAHAAPHDFSVVDIALDSKVSVWAAPGPREQKARPIC